MSADARDLLMRYNNPCNVRELENMIERAVVLAKRGLITARDFPIHVQFDMVEGKSPRAQLNSSLQETLKTMERGLIF